MTRNETIETQPALATAERPEFSFPVDIFDREEEVVLVGDLPGVAGNAVEIQLDRGNLTIRGRVDPPAQDGDWVLQEYRVGDFARSFAVSEDIDAAGIAAQMENGVLTVRLPKSEERRPRRIQVRTG